MKKISALFLDIGGVLLTNGWDRTARHAAAQKFDLDWDEMDERHHLTFDTYEVGKLSLNEYLARVVFYQDRAFKPEAFIDFIMAGSQPYPEMIGLIKTLKNRHHFKVATVSNEGRELTEYRIRSFRLGKFVDFFISSCFVHFRKPDHDMFRLAVDTAQIPIEEIVYVDDRELFVEVAGRMVFHTILHTGLESTREKLARFGVE
jgi:putative hydrolase of the HAD superfamily